MKNEFRISAARLLRRLACTVSPHRGGRPAGDRGLAMTDEQVFLRLDKAIVSGRLYLEERLTLRSLALEVGINRTYVQRALTHRGVRLRDYLGEFRYRYLVELVEGDPEGAMGAEELAERSGFGTPRALNYYLESKMGINLRQLRRRIYAKNLSTSLRASGRANTATRS